VDIITTDQTSNPQDITEIFTLANEFTSTYSATTSAHSDIFIAIKFAVISTSGRQRISPDNLYI
jgi:hypothetical protein